MPPPPQWFAGSGLRWPLRMVIVGSALAPMLYFIAAGSTSAPTTTSFAPASIMPSPSASRGESSKRLDADADVSADSPAQSAASVPAATVDQPPAWPVAGTVVVPQPATAATAPSTGATAARPPAGEAARNLTAQEIALLMQQGEQFVAAGDLVTARAVLRRAAEAGDTTAAIAIGATYDPLVLRKLGVVGMEADIDKARSWYQKAERLGSADATRRLRILAGR
jgi:TPR repeat protein